MKYHGFMKKGISEECTETWENVAFQMKIVNKIGNMSITVRHICKCSKTRKNIQNKNT